MFQNFLFLLHAKSSMESRHEKLIIIHSKINYFYIYRADTCLFSSWIYYHISDIHNIDTARRSCRSLCSGPRRWYAAWLRIWSHQHLESVRQCHGLRRHHLFPFHQRLSSGQSHAQSGHTNDVRSSGRHSFCLLQKIKTLPKTGHHRFRRHFRHISLFSRPFMHLCLFSTSGHKSRVYLFKNRLFKKCRGIYHNIHFCHSYI